MLYLFRSNRTEKLLDALTARVGAPLPDPFLRETIVVQGKGMERWLSIELARRLGVWANPWFPFPRTLLGAAMNAVLGEDSAHDAEVFEPEALLWRIARLLPGLCGRPRFEPIRAYLAGDERGVRLLQLSRHIADVLDRTALYRPEIVRAWEQGDDAGVEDWQPLLWREIVGTKPPQHLAARLQRFLERLPHGPVALPGLPPRISIFGVSTLAPLYLQAFAALAERCLDVDLYVLAPSSEYMPGIVSPREEARLVRKGQLELGLERADLHLERGNPLVASLGTLGRDFQDVLENALTSARAKGDEDFEDPAPDPGRATLLQLVQSDMLHLRERAPGADVEPVARCAPDDSIQVHACHSRMREVEVLHDRLLDLFERDPALQPRDVIVMAPSMDEYAPYVEAVFGAEAGRGRPRIPFELADRGPRLAEGAIDAFFRVLEVVRGRLGASEVFDLLGLDPVRRRFRIDADELHRIRDWIAEGQVRWGADEEHRRAEGQPAIRENTWSFGLDRLVLGFAMPDAADPVLGVLPLRNVRGGDADLLGRFADFATTLLKLRGVVERSHTMEEWSQELGRLLEALVATDGESADQHRRIRHGLEMLRLRAEVAGFDAPLSFDAFERELERELAESARPHGFLSGSVTFCAMVPMRTIPFRVVCLLGLNDATFPRTVQPPAFDLTARRPRAGDRSRRDDDRYLFLEAILSARRHLLVTWIGRSIQDDTAIPPSVVVSDLLDTLAASVTDERDSTLDPITRRRTMLGRLVVNHPLHAFSPRYFEGAPDRAEAHLFSFSRTAAAGARAVRAAQGQASPFVTAPIPPSPSELGTLELEELERFLRNPPRWFCQRRLGLFLGDDAGILDDREPMELDKLEEWEIGDHLLQRLVLGDEPDAVHEALRAGGLLPPGAIGDAVWERISATAAGLATHARSLLQGERLPPLEVDLDLGGVRVTGFLRDVWPVGQLDWRYSKLGGHHELRLWLRHLVLQCLAGEHPGLPRQTFLVGRPEGDGKPSRIVFVPVPEAREVLAQLVALWRAGSAAPTPFFPAASRIYAATLLQHSPKPDAAARALAKARAAFRNRNRDGEEYGEGVDPYVQRLFGDAIDTDDTLPPCGFEAPLPEVFGQVAERVFRPLLVHREEAS